MIVPLGVGAGNPKKSSVPALGENAKLLYFLPTLLLEVVSSNSS